eukprot:CAMPEP_0179209152 /NCGR_PEP_ID=MMETSP0796-20121207/104310_1 /TAXON_ID=73915 /ORGANISM="Pyrodinium bahamense, Strain pbaha01" /LENGTH=288 /DNA_ID=CAMNT_0020914109 /DNA_START=39 /DNA_END=903 /DNA_ORIENTATION=-
MSAVGSVEVVDSEAGAPATAAAASSPVSAAAVPVATALPPLPPEPASTSPLAAAPAVGGLRQNLPGTQAACMWKCTAVAAGGGALAVQEYIQDRIRADPADLDSLYELPAGAAVDPLVWQYEHLRQFVIEFNRLLVALGDQCTPETCPKMTASNEWQYLCAAHRKPQDCAAIDYMTHTIDGSTALLTNAKHFASRSHVPAGNAKFFQSMARRLYRIFAHVFYHHRRVFDAIEDEVHLCARFSHFVMRFKLMSPTMLLVPQDAYEAKAEPKAALWMLRKRSAAQEVRAA